MNELEYLEHLLDACAGADALRVREELGRYVRTDSGRNAFLAWGRPESERYEVDPSEFERLIEGTIQNRPSTGRDLYRYFLKTFSDYSETIFTVPVGRLDLGHIDAFCDRAPNGKPFIVINTGTVGSTNIVLLYVLCFAEYPRLMPFIAGISQWEFAFALLRHATQLRGLPAPPFIFDQERIEGVARACCDFVEPGAALVHSFVFLHEYAHIELGHLDSAARGSLRVSDTEVEYAAVTKEQEFTADTWAVNRLLDLYDPQEFERSRLFPIAVFLRFLDLLEILDILHSRECREHGLEAATETHYAKRSSHPPAIQRVERLGAMENGNPRLVPAGTITASELFDPMVEEMLLTHHGGTDFFRSIQRDKSSGCGKTGC